MREAATATRSAPTLDPALLAPPASPPTRLMSLDAFRGLTVAGMLLVNNPGSWGAIYPPLEHAAWHGWTPTDLIFPFFVFIVGVTTHLSLDSRRARGDDEAAIRRQILKRGAMIILFGYLLAMFPYNWDRIVSVRIPGVLQRIGVAYTLSAFLTLRTTLKQQVLILVGLLYGYWFAMTLLPVPGAEGGIGANLIDDPSRTLGAWVDRTVLGSHLWSGSRTWDPEGILSTIPAIGTAMLGVMAGRWIGSSRDIQQKLNGLFAAGAVGMVAGSMWHWSFPINKGLWTSSYVVFTAGMACVSLAAITWIIDVNGVTRWARPLVIYGMNPMVAFVGSGMMARSIYTLWKVEYGGKLVPAESAVYQSVFLPWLEPKNASLAFAITFVLVWYVILRALWQRRIFLKV